MSNNNVDNKVLSMIAEQLHMNAQEITAQSTLTNLGADSLDRVELIMKFEEEFSIEINDADAEKFITVGDIISYIQSRSQ